MTSKAAFAPIGTSNGRDLEVPLWRLHALRAIALLFAVSGFFSIPRMLIEAGPTDRGMIDGFLTGLWLMSFLALRYPLQMLPLFLFELVWKTIWLLVFGLPQWFTGVGSPRLSQDLLEIGGPPIVLAFVIPWGYVWRHYVKQPGDRWR
ncbi:MAG: hypothetical protein QOF05_679 [Sphingomonadales bacterium]|jgi:hypothetical protein|nr:hypothetical protein [Sphingomonadales bacterium]